MVFSDCPVCIYAIFSTCLHNRVYTSFKSLLLSLSRAVSPSLLPQGTLELAGWHEILASGMLALERKEKRRKAGGKEGRWVSKSPPPPLPSPSQTEVRVGTDFSKPLRLRKVPQKANCRARGACYLRGTLCLTPSSSGLLGIETYECISIGIQN